MNYLQLFYKLTVTGRDGKPHVRKDGIYRENPLCTGLHLNYYAPGVSVLRFTYYLETAHELLEYSWRTSLVETIEEDGDFLIVTTLNSIYTFQKSDDSPFELFLSSQAHRMDA